MSKQGSIREFILTLYLKKYPTTLGKTIGVSIEKIKMEQKIGSKSIDFIGVIKDKRIEVLGEVQIKNSDRYDHLNTKIIPLIDNIGEGYVIWISRKFQRKHIEEVKHFLLSKPHKYINFYAIEISESVLKLIDEELHSLNILDIWEKLDWINEIGDVLKLVDCHLQMPKTHIGRVYVGDYNYDFKYDIEVKEYLAEQLCEKIPYFPNTHTNKKHQQFNCILTFGAGVGGVNYECCAFDKRGLAFVRIRFEKSELASYLYFKQNEILLNECIDSNLCFEDRTRTISYYIKSDRDGIPKVVDEITEVFQRFVIFFSPYTYGGKLKGLLK